MCRTAIIVIIVAANIIQNHGTRYNATNMKFKLLKMDKELLLDAHAKVTGVNAIRQYYSSTPMYNVGRTTCEVRQKYSRMTFMYMQSYTLDEQLPLNIHLDFLIEAQQLGWHIDHLIRMIGVWAIDEREKKKLVKGDEYKNKHKADIDKLKWQIKKDTQKGFRQEDQNDDENNKYLNGFDSDFNR